MAEETRPRKRPKYVDIDGFRLSDAFTVSIFRSALAYKPVPEDIFVVTFPKCGTTWLQHIAYLIFHKGQKPDDALEFQKNSPFLEMVGGSGAELMRRPGVIKTHLPFHLQPYSPSAKYFYVCRNPKDCCVSFYYHTKGFAGYHFTDGTFEDFFEIFINGETDFGDYFDHILSWYEHRNDPNVLFLHYEDIKSDPRFYVLKIAKFLGDEYHSMLCENEDVLLNVLTYSGVDAMKVYTNEGFKNFFSKSLDEQDKEIPEGLRLFHEVSTASPSTAAFVRKGIIGDWNRHLTKEMSDRMDEKIKERVDGTEFIHVWKKYGVIQ